MANLTANDKRPTTPEGKSLHDRCDVKPGTVGRQAIAEADIYGQAQNIVNKFGGVRELCRAVNAILPDGATKWAPSTIYRWTYPKGKNYGTGGEIPVRKIKLVLKAARYWGVMIKIEDLYPDLFDSPI